LISSGSMMQQKLHTQQAIGEFAKLFDAAYAAGLSRSRR
jgi:hypothetical protein